MRRWRDWAWPTCPKTRCRSTSPKDVSSGSLAMGARRFQAITSTIQAADKLRQRSLWWLKRCVTAVQVANVHSYHLAEVSGLVNVRFAPEAAVHPGVLFLRSDNKRQK